MTALWDIALPVLAQMLHVVLVPLAAPVLLGGLDWARGRLAGFHPPGPLAQAAALLAGLRQQPVLTDGVSAVFRNAPLVRLAALLGAAALVPGFASGMALAPAADLLVVAGLLALARGAEICAALDAGDAQSGHAAALLLRRAVWLEPGLVLAAFALAALGEAMGAGGTNLDAILAAARDAPAALRAGTLVVVLALAAMALADVETVTGTGILGADGWQATHGGRDRALLRLGTALRLLVWCGLIGALLLPAMPVPAASPVDWPLGIVGWVARLVLVGMLLLAATATRGAMRPDRASGLPAAGVPLALLALVMLLALAGRA